MTDSIHGPNGGRGLGDPRVRTPRKIARRIPGTKLSELVPEPHTQWKNGLFNPFDSPTPPTIGLSQQLDSQLSLEFDFQEERIYRTLDEHSASAPFPDDGDLSWPDVIGLFSNEAKGLVSGADFSNMFWDFQTPCDLNTETTSQRIEHFVLSSGHPEPTLEEPTLNIRVRIAKERIRVFEILALPGEQTRGFLREDCSPEFSLTPLLIEACKRARVKWGAYADGPVSVRAIKGDRDYGFSFDAIVNCHIGELETHNFIWS
ncbi:hypothetical protein [Corynebacterium riegelii]|uniref:hypothetical protein n=1 Tax=Corynebacterium riegelii TaxID=156976 RepID=UPI000AE4597A|nr:hypothetical protein [Corynebacterium riegelii]